MPANRPTTARAWIATMLALVLVSGHVAGLQVLAWTGILLSRAPERGVAMAVRSTFDLCCAGANLQRSLAGIAAQYQIFTDRLGPADAS